MSKRKNKHVVKAEEIAANPELETAGVKAGDEIEIDITDDVPELTLRADTRAGLAAMIAIARAMPGNRDLQAKLREFDLYEENHRGDLR